MLLPQTVQQAQWWPAPPPLLPLPAVSSMLGVWMGEHLRGPGWRTARPVEVV